MSCFLLKEFFNVLAIIKLRISCSPPSFYLKACDKGTLLLFKKNIPALSFYLPLTVCHPLIGGALPSTVHTFISRWPCSNMKPRAGFPAACLEGLFDLFKILLASRTLEQCPSNTYPASISAPTLKVSKSNVPALPVPQCGRGLATSKKGNSLSGLTYIFAFCLQQTVRTIFIKVHIPQKLVPVAQV